MTLGMVLLIVLVLALLGVVPSWPHSRGWGYAPPVWRKILPGMCFSIIAVRKRRRS